MDIKLQDIELADIEQIRTWRNAPEIARYMYTDNLITEEQQLHWYKKIQTDNTSRHWMVVYEGEKIGLASLSSINTVFSSCHWAFYIGHEGYRGSGIGLKIEYNVVDYVFNELKLNKLICEVFTFNDGVIRLHELFGFRREAYYRQHVKKNGKYEDVIGLALLRSEWKYLSGGLKNLIYRT